MLYIIILESEIHAILYQTHITCLLFQTFGDYCRTNIGISLIHSSYKCFSYLSSHIKVSVFSYISIPTQPTPSCGAKTLTYALTPTPELFIIPNCYRNAFIKSREHTHTCVSVHVLKLTNCFTTDFQCTLLCDASEKFSLSLVTW